MSRRAHCIALFAFAAVLLPASAEPPKSAGSPATDAGTPKLPQTLRLDPVVAARRPPRIAFPGTERLDALFATFKETFTLAKAALEARRRVTEECLARAYTQREQEQAGCRPEQSVQTCSEFLLCWCRRDASHDYSQRYTELVFARRALEEEARRLVNVAESEHVAVSAQRRCAN